MTERGGRKVGGLTTPDQAIETGGKSAKPRNAGVASVAVGSKPRLSIGQWAAAQQSGLP